MKALLEADALLLRGDARLTLPRTTITEMQVKGNDLRLRTRDGDFSLNLGASTAERWLLKLSTPPPSLAQKLGLGPKSKAFLIGDIDDPDVVAALQGGLTSIADEADLSLACISTAEDLDATLDLHRVLAGKPIWIIHGKGKSAFFGEQPTRAYMRIAGFVDTKVSAVSTTRSATRYTPKSA